MRASQKFLPFTNARARSPLGAGTALGGATQRTPPRDNPGQSAVSRAFGAHIDVQTPVRGLFLVAGRDTLPRLAVQSVGGQVLVELGNARALAVLLLSELETLRKHPEVALAGPVSVDETRFSHFMKFAGLDRQANAGQGLSQSKTPSAPPSAQEK